MVRRRVRCADQAAAARLAAIARQSTLILADRQATRGVSLVPRPPMFAPTPPKS
jgi:hypothetical protein